MKKLIFALLACILCLSVCACGKGGDGDGGGSSAANDAVSSAANDAVSSTASDTASVGSDSSVSDVPSLVGEWRCEFSDGTYEILTFNDDGTGVKQTLDIPNEITYTYDGTTLVIAVHVDEPPIEHSYDCRVEGDNLYLRDKDTGNEAVYEKE